jgi:catechol 2,3-dioxygenase
VHWIFISAFRFDAALEATFLSAGGYHHHIALNTWEKQGRIATRIGYRADHFAIRYPTRKSLAHALRRLMQNFP